MLSENGGNAMNESQDALLTYFRDNVRAALRKQGLTQARLAEVLGVTRQHLNAVLKGRVPPGRNLQERIAAALGWPLIDLLQAPTEVRTALAEPGECVRVPRATSFHSGERELVTMAEENGDHAAMVESVVPLPRVLLQERADHPDTLVLMEAEGDAMTPCAHAGDLLLVDQADVELREGRIYVVRMGDQTFVKRFSTAPGKLLFVSDNVQKSYQDIAIPLDDPAMERPRHWDVLGRVFMVIKQV